MRLTTTEEFERRMISLANGLVSPDEIQAMEEEMNYIVQCIASAMQFSDACVLLAKLGELQTLLATMWFKYDIEITPKQKILVRKFDRFDDPDLCAHVFNEIKNGQFLIS